MAQELPDEYWRQMTMRRHDDPLYATAVQELNRRDQARALAQNAAQFNAGLHQRASDRELAREQGATTHQDAVRLAEQKQKQLEAYRQDKMAERAGETAGKRNLDLLNLAQSPALLTSFGKQAPAIQKALMEQFYASAQGGGLGGGGPVAGPTALAGLAGRSLQDPGTAAVRNFHQAQGKNVTPQTNQSPTNAPAGVPQRGGGGFVPSEQPGFRPPGGDGRPYVSPQELSPGPNASPAAGERAAYLRHLVATGQASGDERLFRGGGGGGDITSTVSPDVAGARTLAEVDPAWLAQAQANKANLGYDQYGRIAVIGAGDPSVGALEGSGIRDLGRNERGLNMYELHPPGGGTIKANYSGTYADYLAKHPTYKDMSGYGLANAPPHMGEQAAEQTPATQPAETKPAAGPVAAEPAQRGAVSKFFAPPGSGIAHLFGMDEGVTPLVQDQSTKPTATNRPFFGSPELANQATTKGTPPKPPGPPITFDVDKFLSQHVGQPTMEDLRMRGGSTPTYTPQTVGPQDTTEQQPQVQKTAPPEGPQRFDVRMANEVNNPNVQPNLPNPAPPENVMPAFGADQQAALAAQRAAEEEARRRAAEEAARRAQASRG